MNQKQISGGLGSVVLLASLAAVNDNAYAVSSSALVDVRVVQTIAIANLTGLSFGTVSAGSTPGTVSVQPDGKVVGSGGVTIGDPGTAGAATFQLNGQPDMTFSIQLPQTVQLSNPNGDSMTVGAFQSDPSTTGKLDSTGALLLRVGGALEVGAAQAPGDYTGLMSVSVNYN